MKLREYLLLALPFGFCSATLVGASTTKTVRVEHGRPVVVVTDKQVLLLEFLQEPAEQARVPHDSAEIKHCRARYRFQLYDGAARSATEGQGTVEEIYQVVTTTPTGQEVKDIGSHTTINAGEFTISWSEGTAGSRSWLYYRTDSPVRFIQQPQRLAFDAVHRPEFERYLKSRNVTEFTLQGQAVRIVGPAVFSGELPDETPTSARLEFCQVRDGAVHLGMSGLATNKTYLIESSYQLSSGNWSTVHLFAPGATSHRWSDPLAEAVGVVFYRIREGR